MHDLESELQEQAWTRGSSDPKNRNGNALIYAQFGHQYVVIAVERKDGAVRIIPPQTIGELAQMRKERAFNDADEIRINVPFDKDLHDYLFNLAAAYASVKPYVDPNWEKVACAWFAPAYAPTPLLLAEPVKRLTFWQRLKNAYNAFWH